MLWIDLQQFKKSRLVEMNVSFSVSVNTKQKADWIKRAHEKLNSNRENILISDKSIFQFYCIILVVCCKDRDTKHVSKHSLN